MARVGDAFWLADVFGLADPLRLEGPVDRGEQGQVWRLVTGSASFAVKETLQPIDDDQIELAYAFQSRAAQFGVAAPLQLRATDGRLAIRDGDSTLRLYEWARIARPDLTMDAAAVGEVVAALHRAGWSMSGEVHPWYWEPVGRERWTALARELSHAGAPFAPALFRLLDEMVLAESIMHRPLTGLVLGHRDLWADNVRAADDDGLMIIDWDNCGPVSIDHELALVLVEFGTTDVRVRQLYDAYCSAGGPGRISSLSAFTMPLAILGHLLEASGRQWLAARTPKDRRRAEGRANLFLEDPVTLTDATRIRDLVTWLKRTGRHRGGALTVDLRPVPGPMRCTEPAVRRNGPDWSARNGGWCGVLTKAAHR